MSSLMQPSAWLTRWASLIPAGGRVLDLACGAGRNARWLAQQGWTVEAVDRDVSALAELQDLQGIETRVADLEGAPWPYAAQQFCGIVVCRYLHRPLLPTLAEALLPGGVLIYETFMQGQARYGRPSNPAFLLQPDELRETYAASLDIIVFEQGLEPGPVPAMTQKLCARRPRLA